MKSNTNNWFTDWSNLYNQNQWNISFPIVKKISANTIGGGGWIKSKKQLLKENRLNKLKKIKGERPDVILPNDVWVDGLITVQPLSAPIVNIIFFDYIYGGIKTERKNKLEKIKKLFRIDKIKYINKINNQNG